MAKNKDHITRTTFLKRVQKGLIAEGMNEALVKRIIKKSAEKNMPNPIKITRKDKKKMEDLFNKKGETRIVIGLTQSSRKVKVWGWASFEAMVKCASTAREGKNKASGGSNGGGCVPPPVPTVQR